MGFTAFSFARSKLEDRSKDWATKGDEFYNPIQRYNEQLGIATTNLADFSQGLSSSTTKLQKDAPTTYGQAADVTRDVVGNAPSKPTKGSGLPELFKATNGSAEGALDYLRTMPITDPKQLRKILQDMIASGYDRNTVQGVANSYMANGGPGKVSGTRFDQANLSNIAQSVANTEGDGHEGWTDATAGTLSTMYHGITAGGAKKTALRLASTGVIGGVITGATLGLLGKDDDVMRNRMSASQSGAAIMATALSGIQSTYQAESSRYGSPYASLERLNRGTQLLGGLAPAAVGGNTDHQAGATREQLARSLSKLTGGGYGDYIREVSTRSTGQILLNAAGDNQKTQQQAILNVLQDTKQGRKYLSNLRDTTGIDFSTPTAAFHLSDDIRNSLNAGGSDFNKLIAKQGALGQFASKDTDVQNAIGIMQSDPKTVNAATNKMLAKAESTSGSMEGASKALQAMADKTGDLTSPFSQLALAAKSLANEWIQFRMPTMNRNEQLGVVVGQFKDATNADRDGGNYQKNQEAARQQYQQSRESYRQYLVGLQQQFENYAQQRQDSDQDYYQSLQRNQEDFQRQEMYSQEDFDKQMYRAHRDRNIQMRFSARQAAQSIYDPTTRIQPMNTAGSSTIDANLGDQNAALQRQMKELKALKRMGLSLEAIQTLNLADPSQAQQLDRLYLQARGGDTGWITQFNAQTAKRIKLTKALTQSDFSLSFQQSNESFTQGLKDASKDYKEAQERARAAQALSLNRMGDDYQKMVRRSARDLRKGLREMNEDVGKAFSNVMRLTNGQIARYAPAAASMIDKQLSGLKKNYPMLFDKNWDGTSTPKFSTATTGPKGQQLTYGAVGVAADGKSVGRYDQFGGFHAVAGPYDASRLQPAVGPKSAAKKAKGKYANYTGPLGEIVGHASGGISTYAHVANISEDNKAEAIIPLDMRGQSFMVGMYNSVSKVVAQQMRTSGHRDASGQSIHIVKTDNSSNFSGPITVVAQDTKAMLADLAHKNRLNRLQAAGRKS